MLLAILALHYFLGHSPVVNLVVEVGIEDEEVFEGDRAIPKIGVREEPLPDRTDQIVHPVRKAPPVCGRELLV
ncbi:MAG: hypothetical protein MR009_03400 [Sutterellaceae bacterium]|nr:hypothetical protein [Sutterellaceae bacterium]